MNIFMIYFFSFCQILNTKYKFSSINLPTKAPNKLPKIVSSIKWHTKYTLLIITSITKSTKKATKSSGWSTFSRKQRLMAKFEAWQESPLGKEWFFSFFLK